MAPTSCCRATRVIGRLQLRNDYVDRPRLEPAALHHRARLRRHAVRRRRGDRDLRRYGFSRDRVFVDVGYSFRVLHDAFGVHQQLLSIDVAVPLNRHAPYTTCLGVPIADANRPPFVVLVSFFPSF